MHTNELQGATAKRAALRPPTMRGVLTIDSKGQWSTQELYRNIRARTRANNESIWVLGRGWFLPSTTRCYLEWWVYRHTSSRIRENGKPRLCPRNL